VPAEFRWKRSESVSVDLIGGPDPAEVGGEDLGGVEAGAFSSAGQAAEPPAPIPVRITRRAHIAARFVELPGVFVGVGGDRRQPPRVGLEAFFAASGPLLK